MESGHLLCVIGDVGEVKSSVSAPYANATVMGFDLQNSTITISTSLTGLPPVFTFRRGSGVSLSSPFIPTAAKGSLDPDMDGIADMLRWGHPLDGRTLFADLKAVSSYATFIVSADGSVDTPRPVPWPSLENLSSLTPEELVREQIERELALDTLASQQVKQAGIF
jgi:hypothetical protein